VRAAAAALVALVAAAPAVGQPQSGSQDKVIDVRSRTAAAGNSFEGLWAAQKKAERKGDLVASQSTFREIRRLRIERNVRSLETLAMARVADGMAALGGNPPDADKAASYFADAAALDPYLPDPHFGLALAAMKKGPLGIGTAIKETIAGTSARLTSGRGALYLKNLLGASGLLALFITVCVFALAMVLRHATLLRHDLEEALGSGRRATAFGITVALLLLPAITFQGWGWLPLWWLAVLFLYMAPIEKGASVVALLATLAVGPAVQKLEARLLAQQNPLFRASMLAVEGEPDSRAIWQLEDAARAHADDRDLQYLLAVEYKKAGRYGDAGNIYKDLLRAAPTDSIALNNLANVEFAAGEFPAAIARYKQGIDSAPPADIAATFYYNLSLAHLQRFEFQPATEARSQADRLSSGLIRSYDNLWKYDKGDYAVVDLTLSPAQVWAKFAGLREGTGAKNVAADPMAQPVAQGPSGFVNRFTVFPILFALTFFGLYRWRGAKAFTMRCLKCGTPFCRLCHLGVVTGGLCTQCHHLFVVRDGVSGPARNQKLLEVQKEDSRRDRVFRVLSLLIPGAGHLYANKALIGLPFVLLWSAILSLALVSHYVLPVTEAAGALSPPWGFALGGVLLLILYVAANRVRPDFEVRVTARRPPPQRARKKEAA
jgi:tetratricopeptide (TPR) repeat protein